MKVDDSHLMPGSLAVCGPQGAHVYKTLNTQNESSKVKIGRNSIVMIVAYVKKSVFGVQCFVVCENCMGWVGSHQLYPKHCMETMLTMEDK